MWIPSRGLCLGARDVLAVDGVSDLRVPLLASRERFESVRRVSPPASNQRVLYIYVCVSVCVSVCVCVCVWCGECARCALTETSVWLRSTSALQLGLLLADSDRISSSPLYSMYVPPRSDHAIIWPMEELQRRNAKPGPLFSLFFPFFLSLLNTRCCCSSNSGWQNATASKGHAPVYPLINCGIFKWKMAAKENLELELWRCRAIGLHKKFPPAFHLCFSANCSMLLFFFRLYENIFIASCPQSHITTSPRSKNNTLLHRLHNTDYTINTT